MWWTLTKALTQTAYNAVLQLITGLQHPTECVWYCNSDYYVDRLWYWSWMSSQGSHLHAGHRDGRYGGIFFSKVSLRIEFCLSKLDPIRSRGHVTCVCVRNRLIDGDRSQPRSLIVWASGPWQRAVWVQSIDLTWSAVHRADVEVQAGRCGHLQDEGKTQGQPMMMMMS